MDTQTIELLGRNRLVNELLLAGLEVALPARDRGVDLIAYVDLESITTQFTAVPIQMKAASKQTFSVSKKYSRIANLTLAYVWGVQKPELAVTYALSYLEAVAIAEKMGWTKTASWEKGAYSTSQPSQKLHGLLEPYEMSPKAWRERIMGYNTKIKTFLS